MASKRKLKQTDRNKNTSKSSKKPKNDAEPVQVEEEEFRGDEVDEVGYESEEEGAPPVVIRSRSNLEKKKKKVDDDSSKFVGEAVADKVARKRWPHRYLSTEDPIVTVPSKGRDPVKQFTQAKRHYTEAVVDGVIQFKLEDHGHVYAGKDEAGKDMEPHICRIVEMFEGIDGKLYFCAQWFYRPKDTTIQACSTLIEDKRIFISEMTDDNLLDCLTQKVKIVEVPLDVDGDTKRNLLSDGNYYYDLMYDVSFSTFKKLPTGINDLPNIKHENGEKLRMLDLYAGCGAMSTGLCLGADLANVNLVTSWAVDFNKFACKSLQLNHPETQVRNESAEDFLQLLKEWERLYQLYVREGEDDDEESEAEKDDDVDDDEKIETENDDDEDDDEVYEVEKIVSICYGDKSRNNQPGVHLKIRWKGFDETYDTWEPIDKLRNCKKRIKEFVIAGFNSKILPLPGDADVICGGPPCQGVSGFNRFRNKDKPLDDDKNKQLIVYMDIVEFLKPRFVLMENVVDILRFANGFLGRYALARLTAANYQARVGLMTAGCYGLPQFRMRMFMWAAKPNEMLPQYPLPTHDVVKRGAPPVAFESNVVAYGDMNGVELEKALKLGDAISDLPPVTNDEERDEISYGEDPKTDFQAFIRLNKQGVVSPDHLLYDHLPYKCNKDDFERVCQIPKKKGANFRDLPDVIVNQNNEVRLDTKVKRKTVSSGKPLVPEYALRFVKGKSLKPFGRVWWDEIVSTVVTRPQPHNQAILHPEQDRVLTVRENARIQGFPDYYKLVGPVKEKYVQVGNAVAVPVARALGYSLALSLKGTASEEPVFVLPKDFPKIEEAQ